MFVQSGFEEIKTPPSASPGESRRLTSGRKTKKSKGVFSMFSRKKSDTTDHDNSSSSSASLWSEKTSNQKNKSGRAKSFFRSILLANDSIQLESIQPSHYFLSSAGSTHVNASDTYWVGGLRSGIVNIYDLSNYGSSKFVVPISGMPYVSREYCINHGFGVIRRNDQIQVLNIRDWIKLKEENPNSIHPSGVVGIFAPKTSKSLTQQSYQFIPQRDPTTQHEGVENPPPGDEQVWVSRRCGSLSGHCPFTGLLLENIPSPLVSKGISAPPTVFCQIGSKVWCGCLGGSISRYDIINKKQDFFKAYCHPDTVLDLQYYARLGFLISTSMQRICIWKIDEMKCIAKLAISGTRWTFIPEQQSNKLFTIWAFGQNGLTEIPLVNHNSQSNSFTQITQLDHAPNLSVGTSSKMYLGLTSGFIYNGNIVATSKHKQGEYAQIVQFSAKTGKPGKEPFLVNGIAAYSLNFIPRKGHVPLFSCGLKLNDRQQYLGFFRPPGVDGSGFEKEAPVSSADSHGSHNEKLEITSTFIPSSSVLIANKQNETASTLSPFSQMASRFNQPSTGLTTNTETSKPQHSENIVFEHENKQNSTGESLFDLMSAPTVPQPETKKASNSGDLFSLDSLFSAPQKQQRSQPQAQPQPQYQQFQVSQMSQQPLQPQFNVQQFQPQNAIQNYPNVQAMNFIATFQNVQPQLGPTSSNLVQSQYPNYSSTTQQVKLSANPTALSNQQIQNQTIMAQKIPLDQQIFPNLQQRNNRPKAQNQTLGTTENNVFGI